MAEARAARPTKQMRKFDISDGIRDRWTRASEVECFSFCITGWCSAMVAQWTVYKVRDWNLPDVFAVLFMDDLLLVAILAGSG